MSVNPVVSLEHLGIKTIKIPACNFVFQRVRGVLCNEFRLAETPFTNGQYKKLLEQAPEELAEIVNNPPQLLERSLKVALKPAEAEDCPLVFIDQFESAGIAKLLGGRLPTELERERAAAGIMGWRYPWGDTEPDPTKVEFNVKGTMAVKSHPAGMNSEGFYDLVGGVLEWTGSIWGEINLTNPQEPVFPQSGKSLVLRGCSWYCIDPAKLFSSYRGHGFPKTRSGSFGFRLAMGQ